MRFDDVVYAPHPASVLIWCRNWGHAVVHNTASLTMLIEERKR